MRKIIRSAVLLSSVLIASLIIAIFVSTSRQVSKQVRAQEVSVLAINETKVLQNLSEAIQLKTIASADDEHLNAEEFLNLHRLLRARFPLVYANAQEEIIQNYSILLRIPGSDAKAQGIMLLAHQDVVPIAPGTEEGWSHPPFSGAIKEGYVWGRGAWDNKSNLMAQLEALELLLEQGFKPQRSIYFTFGADEEILGLRGAAQVARKLKQENLRFHSVLDEGLLITHGMLPGLEAPAALIGVAEKGYLSVELKVKAQPGHSSMPPQPGTSAIAKLSKLVNYLDQHPRPTKIAGVAYDLFNTVAPEMHGINRYALTNLWLFDSFVKAQLEKGDASRALLQTTMALTMSQAGNKENVMPGEAQVTINYRILPGDSVKAILEDLRVAARTQLGDDEFTIQALPRAVEASKISPSQSIQYKQLEQSIKDIFPTVVIAPGLMLGATDSIKFEDLSDHIYKFSPVHANNQDLARFHGTNERIATSNYIDMIRFYHRYLSLASQTAVSAH